MRNNEANGMLLRPKLKETEISFLLACLIITSQKPLSTKWLGVNGLKMFLFSR